MWRLIKLSFDGDKAGVQMNSNIFYHCYIMYCFLSFNLSSCLCHATVLGISAASAESSVLRMIGIPFHATDEDVVSFFKVLSHGDSFSVTCELSFRYSLCIIILHLSVF